MKYTNILRITFYADVGLPVEIQHNEATDVVVIKKYQDYTLTLAPNENHTIKISLKDHPYQKFLYIKKVYLGNLDITELLHHDNICSVALKENNEIIGNFLEDLGLPDIMTMQINAQFYSNIFNHLNLVESAE